MHKVEFSDEELKTIRSIGVENEDYAICAIFESRNSGLDVDYEEERKVITVGDGENEIQQTVPMITEVCESPDPLQRIGVGVSMLEVAVNVEEQWKD